MTRSKVEKEEGEGEKIVIIIKDSEPPGFSFLFSFSPFAYNLLRFVYIPHTIRKEGEVLSTQIHFPGISRIHLHYSFTPLRRRHRGQPRPCRQRRHKSWAYRNRWSGSRLVRVQELQSPALAARASGMKGVKGRGFLLLLLLLLFWLLLLLFLRDRLMILE